jgi:hypothetical protein
MATNRPLYLLFVREQPILAPEDRKRKWIDDEEAREIFFSLLDGFVFSVVYLVELFPESNSFRRGWEEGATDAQTKVHEGKKRESEPIPSKRSGKHRKR